MAGGSHARTHARTQLGRKKKVKNNRGGPTKDSILMRLTAGKLARKLTNVTRTASAVIDTYSNYKQERECLAIVSKESRVCGIISFSPFLELRGKQ